MNEQPAVRRDLTHTILSIIFICLLVASTFWVLRPFLVSLVWGSHRCHCYVAAPGKT